MAFYYSEPSHTFSEYLLIPGYSRRRTVSLPMFRLRTPLTRFRKGEEPAISLNIPMVSAIMQSVSDDSMAIALAKEGGAVLYLRLAVHRGARRPWSRRVKNHKAGFVVQRLQPDAGQHAGGRPGAEGEERPLHRRRHGRRHGQRQAAGHRHQPRLPRQPHGLDAEGQGLHDAAGEARSPRRADTTLKEANDIIWEHKLNSLPIVDAERPPAVLCVPQGLRRAQGEPARAAGQPASAIIVGAGINTRDYAERVPALVEAGADVLCIDSSEGYSEWQKQHHRLGPRAVRRHASRWARATWWTGTASASWPRPARTSSRSASAAAPSASPARQKGIGRGQATAAHRGRPPPATSISRRPASTCPSAPTAASSTTTT